PLDDIWQEAGYAYVEKVRSGKKENPDSFLMQVVKGVVGELGFNLPGSAVGMTSSAEESKDKEKKKPEAPKLTAGQNLELGAIENKMTKLGFETTLRIVSVGTSAQASQQ